VIFEQDREGTLYEGTPITLTCIVVLSLDMALVDTNVTVTFNYSNLPPDPNRVSTSSRALNSSAFQGDVVFNFLLLSDGGVEFGCSSTVEPEENGLPVQNPVATHILKVEGTHNATYVDQN
jgi:hypothetical protein